MMSFKNQIFKYGRTRRSWVRKATKALVVSGLAVVSSVYLRVSSPQAVASGFVFLSEGGLHLLRLLIRDTQKSTQSKVSEDMLLMDIDLHFNQLEVQMKHDIRQLFLLLKFHPIRMMAGIRAQVVDSVEHPYIFLCKLRTRRLANFKIAYRYLLSVIQLHLYKYSEAWPDSRRHVTEQRVAISAG